MHFILATVAHISIFLASITSAQQPLRTRQQEQSHARQLGHYEHPRLGKCEADCDHYYKDCAEDLACWYRDPSTHYYYSGKSGKGGKGGGFRNLNFDRNKIPGCSAVTPKNEYDDYCIDPHSFPKDTLWYVGDDHKPRSVFPLKNCWGDCDHDDDCADGLICLHRDRHSPDEVPGCEGKAYPKVDYCIIPPPTPRPTPHPTPRPTPRPTPHPTAAKHPLEFVGHCNGHYRYSYGRGKGYNPCYHFPLEKCEGDCDSDHDCKGHLICFFRDNNKGPIPGCKGTPERDTTDYCIDPDDIPKENDYYIYWGDSKRTVPSGVYPFGPCQGDCDSDHDCESGLRCSAENSNANVPGCSGHKVHGVEYCY